jgi:hypothetical protein
VPQTDSRRLARPPLATSSLPASRPTQLKKLRELAQLAFLAVKTRVYAASVKRDLSLARWLNGVLALLFLLCAVAPSCAPPDFNFTGKDPNEELPDHCLNQELDEGETDVDCGAECDPCELGQACAETRDCLEGECLEGFCQDPSCSDDVLSGDESDVDCGGSCRPCPPGSLCGDNDDCDSKVCSDEGVCAEPSCNDRVFNGDESDIDCGGSCPKCPPGRRCREGEDCIGDVCGLDDRCIVVCLEGRADCDLSAENSCEVNLKTDPENCGACGDDCALAHAVPGCSGAECFVASCVGRYLDCNGDPSDGCEVNGGSDVENCGACGKKCPAAQGKALCIDGECDIECDEGFANCDGNLANGCEKSVTGDVNNCGGCGKVCPSPLGETPWCVDGVCGSTACPDGFGDCNGKPEDGCEVDLRSNADHCNTCGNFCAALNGTAACDERVCIVESCDPGHADCNKQYVDGCEVDTDSSLEHCGACDAKCEIENANFACESGECRVKSCKGSYRDCDGDGVDCEVNIATDADHCGGCEPPAGHDCSEDFASRHANGVCVNEVCQPGTCYPDYANCNGLVSDGCEVYLKGDKDHCGSCSISCASGASVHATSTSCSNGTCNPVCEDGWAHCGNPEKGCLVSLDTAQHCGDCQTSCTGGTPFCVSRTCVPRLPIVLESSTVSGSVLVCNNSPCSNFSVQLSHTVTKGQGNYRVVVIAVASSGQDAGAATPNTVSYGSANAAVVRGVWAGNRAWAGLYVVKDAQLPSTAGTASTVAVNFGSVDAASRAAIAVYEFSGVEQGTPVAADVGSAKNNCSTAPPSDNISIATAGSHIVSVAALFGQTSATPVGLIERLDRNASEFTALSGHAQTTSTGSHTVGWTTSNCNTSAHAVLALDPAKTP